MMMEAEEEMSSIFKKSETRGSLVKHNLNSSSHPINSLRQRWSAPTADTENQDKPEAKLVRPKITRIGSVR
jgi:hypothetical protein